MRITHSSDAAAPPHSTEIADRHVRVSPGSIAFGMPSPVGSALSASTKFVIGSRQINPEPLENVSRQRSV